MTTEAEAVMCLHAQGAEDGRQPPEARGDGKGPPPELWEGVVALLTP